MRTKSLRKIPVTSLFLLAVWLPLLSISTAASQLLSDDFNDNTTNPSLWTPFQNGFGPIVAETNQRLEITHPANSADHAGFFMAGYTSVCQLRADFDIQVDYHLLVWPLSNGVRVGLNTDVGAVERLSVGTFPDFPSQPREVYVTDYSGVLTFASTGDLSGRLRLIRAGGTLTGYYYNSGWVPIQTHTVSTADLQFALLSWSHEIYFRDQEVKIAFDNFILNAGQLICPQITVSFDIQPGAFPNSINPKKQGVIPVAILTTNTFDATTVDPSTVLFGPTGTEAAPVRFTLEDVDRDGDTDMILHFSAEATGIVCGHSSAALTGKTFSGQPIEGADSIKTVGCKKQLGL